MLKYREEQSPCRIWNTWRRISSNLYEEVHRLRFRSRVYVGEISLPAGFYVHSHSKVDA